METRNTILASWREYQSLPSSEWRKDFFCPHSGGFVATHIYKEKDNLRRPGIAAEVKACFELAKLGKHILRLPENTPDLIDDINVSGLPYRELLNYKPGETNPRGYPDAYFDGRTWDFKAPEFNNNVDSLRQLIKDGRKADNTVFIVRNESHVEMIKEALSREIGRHKKDGLWRSLPNIYYMINNQLTCIWEK